MPAPEGARWWSWRRQRLDRTARGVEDALRSVLAITSANPSAPLALLARVPRMLHGMYDGAVRARTAIRLPAMRRAIWLLAAETAHIPFHACRGTGSTEQAALRRAGVGPDLWNELRTKILDLCGQPRDARDIKELIPADREKVNAVINVLAVTGELVRVRAPSLTSSAFTFAATETWLGRPLPQMARDDALAFLAGDYLQSYGPATLDDFVWWTGLPAPRCEAALLQHDPMQLDDGYLLWPAHARAFEQSRPVANRVSLLPAWDPYPMGYLDRSRMGTPEIVETAFDRAGNSLPVVLVEGAIGGLWDYKVSRGTCVVTVGMFDDPGPRLWEAIESEAGGIAALFGARELRLVRAKTKASRREGEPPRAPAVAPVARPAKRAARPAKRAAARAKPAKRPAVARGVVPAKARKAPTGKASPKAASRAKAKAKAPAKVATKAPRRATGKAPAPAAKARAKARSAASKPAKKKVAKKAR